MVRKKTMPIPKLIMMPPMMRIAKGLRNGEALDLESVSMFSGLDTRAG